jgi:hypothetical protein
MSERLGSDFYVSPFLLRTAGDQFADLSALSTSILHRNLFKPFQPFSATGIRQEATGNSRMGTFQKVPDVPKVPKVPEDSP